jgi:hypothetical protein
MGMLDAQRSRASDEKSVGRCPPIAAFVQFSPGEFRRAHGRLCVPRTGRMESDSEESDEDSSEDIQEARGTKSIAA